MKEIDVLQIFKEYYPSYMRGDTPLEPYYSFFCGGFSACEETLVKELENQIEQMKCCVNCKYRYTENFPTRTEPCNKCLRYSKWEIRQ